MTELDRIVVNPELYRVPGHATAWRLRGEPEALLELPPAAVSLLAQLRAPRALDEVASEPSATARELVLRLLERRVLLREGDTPRRGGVVRSPALPTFASVPRWDASSGSATADGAFVVVGVRYDEHTLSGYPRGTARGPEGIRQASNAMPLRHGVDRDESLGYYDVDAGHPILKGAGVRILDGGNIEGLASCPWSEIAVALRATVHGIRAHGATPVVLGGDHSVSLPVVEALAASGEPFGIIHLDAHTDGGEILFPGHVHHGNVLRHVAALPSVVHVLQLGHRGIQMEAPSLPGVAYDCFSVQRLRAMSAEDFGALCRRDIPYYLTMDIDALDPSVAPGTPVPEVEGLLLTEARALLRGVTRGIRLLGMDLVEVLPEAAPPTLTCRTALQLLLEAIDCARRP